MQRQWKKSKKVVHSFCDNDLNNIYKFSEQDMNMFDFHRIPVIAMVPFMYYMMADLLDKIMVDDEIVKLMKSKEKYDVCVIEVFNMDAIMVIILFNNKNKLKMKRLAKRYISTPSRQNLKEYL